MSDPGAMAGSLRALTAAALAATSVDDVVAAHLEAVRALIGADQVHLIEVSQDATVGYGRVAAQDAGGLHQDAYSMVLDERPSGTSRVVATGELLHVPDAVGSDALRPDYVRRFDVRSALFVPLAWAGAVRWVAILIRSRAAAFTDVEVELAQAIANASAAGFALVEAAAAEADREGHHAALARAAAAVNAGLTPEAALEAVCAEVDRALGGDLSGVYLGDADAGVVAIAGHNEPAGWRGYLMRPGEGAAGRVIASGRAVTANAYQDEGNLPDVAGLRGLRTAVSVPVSWDGAVRGALSVGFARMRRVSAADRRTLEAFADLAALAARGVGRLG